MLIERLGQLAFPGKPVHRFRQGSRSSQSHYVGSIQVFESRQLLSVVSIATELHPTIADDDTRNSSVDIGQDGTVVVAWEETVGPTISGHQNVRFRRYTSDGQPIAVVRTVSSATASDEINPAVAVAPNGSFVIGYHTLFNAYYDIYAADGAFVRRVDVNTSSGGSIDEFDLTMSSQGNVVTTWREINAQTGYGDIRARAFDQNGNPLNVSPVAVTATSGIQERTPSVAVDHDGNYVVVYAVGTTNIAFRRFSLTGTSLGNVQFVSPPLKSVDQYLNPEVSRAYDGRFVIGYTFHTPSGYFGYWELFTADGSRVNDGFTDTTKSKPLNVDMDGVGNFVIGYTANAPSANDQPRVTFYNSQGLEGDTVILNGGFNSESPPDVALTNNLLATSYTVRGPYRDEIELSLYEQRRGKFGVARANAGGGLTFYLDSNANQEFDQFDSTFNFGLAGDIVIVGDWNGDGIDDLGVGRPNSGGGLTFYLDSNSNLNFDPLTDEVFDFGLVGDQIVVGDWNGDDIDDLGVGRPNGSGGLIFSLDSNGSLGFDNTDAVFNFGNQGDRIIVGDWNGSGIDTLGVARPNGYGGMTFSLDSNDTFSFEANQDAVFNYGLERDSIVVGDWDGDGIDGLGVARTNAGGGLGISLDVNENLSFDLTDALFAFDFGLPGDLLVVGAWRQTSLRNA